MAQMSPQRFIVLKKRLRELYHMKMNATKEGAIAIYDMEAEAIMFEITEAAKGGTNDTRGEDQRPLQ